MEKNRKVNPLVLERFRYSTDQIIDKPFNWKQMSRLITYLKPYSKNLLPASIMTVLVTTAVRLIIPILIGVYALDQAINQKKDFNMLMIIVAIIAGLYLISYVANIYRIKWSFELGQGVIYDLRKACIYTCSRAFASFF